MIPKIDVGDGGGKLLFYDNLKCFHFVKYALETQHFK